jgi:hypothetical protein
MEAGSNAQKIFPSQHYLLFRLDGFMIKNSSNHAYENGYNIIEHIIPYEGE